MPFGVDNNSAHDNYYYISNCDSCVGGWSLHVLNIEVSVGWYSRGNAIPACHNDNKINALHLMASFNQLEQVYRTYFSTLHLGMHTHFKANLNPNFVKVLGYQ